MSRFPERFAAIVREHRTGLLAGGLTALFVILAGAAFGVGFATAPVADAGPTRSPTAASATPTPRPTPVGAPGPSRLRTCSVADAAADPRLRTLEARVVNATSGEVLFDRAGTTPKPTGSLVKVLTASAAVAVLGPDYRISTDVVDTGTGIALVGHGDPTLSRTPAGAESWYRGAPKLADLAQQTLASWTTTHPGERITSLALDATYWSDADKWDATWPESERTDGWQSEVTALQIDGDRDDPYVDQSPRSTDPVGRAGTAFVQALRSADTSGVIAPDIEVTVAAAPSGSAALASVQSQPVSTLIGQMFAHSDNALGEMLARIVSVKAGGGGTAASLATVIPTALAAYEVTTDGISVRDGSGESLENAIPPAYLTALMIKIQAGGQHLDILRDALPVAGQAGSLEDRFTGADARARGDVAAKTGWLLDVYSLAGIIDARDGTTLTFAFYALGEGIGTDDEGKAALDALTTAVWSCGDNLANT